MQAKRKVEQRFAVAVGMQDAVDCIKPVSLPNKPVVGVRGGLGINVAKSPNGFINNRTNFAAVPSFPVNT